MSWDFLPFITLHFDPQWLFAVVPVPGRVTQVYQYHKITLAHSHCLSSAAETCVCELIKTQRQILKSCHGRHVLSSVTSLPVPLAPMTDSKEEACVYCFNWVFPKRLFSGVVCETRWGVQVKCCGKTAGKREEGCSVECVFLEIVDFLTGYQWYNIVAYKVTLIYMLLHVNSLILTDFDFLIYLISDFHNWSSLKQYFVSGTQPDWL